jgi:hypothetical protein
MTDTQTNIDGQEGYKPYAAKLRRKRILAYGYPGQSLACGDRCQQLVGDVSLLLPLNLTKTQFDNLERKQKGIREEGES